MNKLAGLLVAIVFCLLIPVIAYAQVAGTRTDNIVGVWEGIDDEVGQLYVVEFTDGDLFFIQTYDIEGGPYVIDEKGKRVAVDFVVTGMEDQEPEWMPYSIRDGVLTIGPVGEELEFDQTARPEKPANELCGRWDVREFAIEGDVVISWGELFIKFNNDMTVFIAELDEEMTGTYTADPKTGMLVMEIQEDEKTASFHFTNGILSITIDDETMEFERAI